MNSRNLFLSPRMGNDLLIAASGEKVIIYYLEVALMKRSLTFFLLFFLIKKIYYYDYYIFLWPSLGLVQLIYFNNHLQAGSFVTANMIWDLMQGRKIYPLLPAVEAYYNGLKVSSNHQERVHFVLLYIHRLWTVFSLVFQKLVPPPNWVPTWIFAFSS